jgi:HPt (histidine-containing phosphotransfer) domain-containing protein
MDDFIVKPVQLPELEAALHRALADRATQQAMEEVIDPVVIAGLRQLRILGKPDPLAEIIDLFLQEAPAQLDVMRQAIVKSDMTAMARIISAATALKGSASNLGASNLAALGDEIEQAAKAGFLADAVPVLDKAAAEFARVRDTLEKMKSEAKAG